MTSQKAFWCVVLLVLAVGYGANARAAATDADDWTFAAIDFPGASSTAALDITAAGDIVGTYNDAIGSHGFFRGKKGDYVSIDFPGAVFTRTTAINSRGDIVGHYRFASDSPQARHGFLLRDGEFTTIDPPNARFTNVFGINNRGDIVGVYDDATGFHGFLLTRGKLGEGR